MFVPSLKLVVERPSATTAPVSSGPVHHVYSKFVGVSSRQRSKRSPSERVEWSLATKESQTHHQQSQRPCQLKAAQIRSNLQKFQRQAYYLNYVVVWVDSFQARDGRFRISWNINVTTKLQIPKLRVTFRQELEASFGILRLWQRTYSVRICSSNQSKAASTRTFAEALRIETLPNLMKSDLKKREGWWENSKSVSYSEPAGTQILEKGNKKGCKLIENFKASAWL